MELAPERLNRNQIDDKALKDSGSKPRSQEALHQEAKTPRSQEAPKPRSQETSKPRSPKARKPRSQEARKPGSHDYDDVCNDSNDFCDFGFDLNDLACILMTPDGIRSCLFTNHVAHYIAK